MFRDVTKSKFNNFRNYGFAQLPSPYGPHVRAHCNRQRGLRMTGRLAQFLELIFGHNPVMA
jgi:hypothetical protein